MVRASVWLIRIALLHLALGFLAGGVFLLHKGGWLPALPGLLSVHIELVLMGFMVLLALAVAWWIFPRVKMRRPPEQGAWIAGGLFISGVWMVVTGAWTALLYLSLAGRLLELSGILVLIFFLWPRIRPYRRKR